MLIMQKYLGPVGVGVTSPQLFADEEGNVYIVKLQNNVLGKKILVNEYIAYQLGKKVGLCFPSGTLVAISEAVIGQSRWLSRHKVVAGPHFGCVYLGKTAYLEKSHLRYTANVTQMAGVILFDHLFHNIDRTKNRKNLLVKREGTGYKIYAIDNSHLFRIGIWNIESLKKLQEKIILNFKNAYGTLIRHYLSIADFKLYAKSIQAVTDFELMDIVESIPIVWLPDGQERAALLEYIQVRRDKVSDIADKLCALIPNVHRATDINQGK